jgi:hypothetical protein
MPPHLLLHAGHLFKDLFTSSEEDGGAWAWVGLIAGGIVGYMLTFADSGGIIWTPELLAGAIFVCGAAAIAGAYVGCLVKAVVDHLVRAGSPPRD